MITRETIEQRLAQLKAERDQLQASLQQTQANLNAYAGAIQDCEYWLSELEKEEKEDK